MDPKDLKTLHEIVKQARINLNDTSWDYLVGGSETETTLRRNRFAIDSLGLLPKVLNDVSKVDTRSQFLGEALEMPVMLAPIGSLQVLDASGGIGVAQSAETAGVMAMISSVCEPELEDVAAASNGLKIHQLYARGDDDWVDDVIERAISNHYTGFCLTVDTAVVSRRERDIAKRVVPTSQSAGEGDFTYQASLSWRSIERIKKKFDIPLVIKGISRADDAIKAVDLGVEVIYVSNHGGRQLDQSVASISLLPEIVSAINGRAEIAVDGGFYRGSDIVKALALGADVVGLGRLQGWAMAAGGAPMVIRMLQLLKREISMTMALCGVTSISELDASFITKADVVSSPDVLSAFPLISEGY
jgi:isopentenyl diphosphate isomerase/L-lactate dehydrogenase-like FMN-dependent dehydrogenase